MAFCTLKKWNKLLNYLDTVYNVYCNETDISVHYFN